MNDTMRLPSWLSRDHAEDERRERSIDAVGAAIMGDLEGLRWQLDKTVRDLEAMVEPKDDS